MLGDYAHLRLKHKFENFTHFAAREKTTANYHVLPTSMHQRHQVLNGRAAAFSFFFLQQNPPAFISLLRPHNEEAAADAP